MASIKCGNCRNSHGSVAEVRACYGKVNPPANSGNDTFANRTPEYRANPGTAVDRIRAAAAKLPDVPVMRYAIEEAGTVEGTRFNFYKIDRPQTGRWKGYTFVKRFSSDDEYPVKNLDRVGMAF